MQKGVGKVVPIWLLSSSERAHDGSVPEEWMDAAIMA